MKGENEMALPTTAFYLISHYGAGLPLNRYGSGAYAVNQQFSLYDAASDDQKFKLVTVNNKQRAAAIFFLYSLAFFSGFLSILIPFLTSCAPHPPWVPHLSVAFYVVKSRASPELLR